MWLVFAFNLEVVLDHELDQAWEVDFALPAQFGFGLRWVTKQQVYL